MNDQNDLFQGVALRDEGMKKVIANNQQWREHFDRVAWHILIESSKVTSDAVVRVIGMPEGSSNAVGAAMRAFAKAHKLRVLEYVKTTRPTRHAGIVAVWGR